MPYEPAVGPEKRVIIWLGCLGDARLSVCGKSGVRRMPRVEVRATRRKDGSSSRFGHRSRRRIVIIRQAVRQHPGQRLTALVDSEPKDIITTRRMEQPAPYDVTLDAQEGGLRR